MSMAGATGWHVVCPIRELKGKPVRVWLSGRPYVLWRNGDQIAMLEDRCPHRNAPLSKGCVKQGRIQCPYHGWRFGRDGQVKDIPGLPDLPVQSGKFSVAAMDTKTVGPLVFARKDKGAGLPYLHPLAKATGYTSFVWQTDARGSLMNVAENFLDGFHTHYVHAGLIRAEQKRQQVSAEIRRSADRVEVIYTGEEGQNGLISRLFEPKRVSSHARFILPGIAELEYRSDAGTELVITAYLSEAEVGQVKAHVLLTLKGNRFRAGIKKAALMPFFKLALKQDKRIVEWQAQTIAAFGEEAFQSTSLDIVRPHMEDLLINGPRDRDFPVKHKVLSL
ncbi:Rieske 2Fe-2S domain-containing protein [Terasakiella pusilla]|uniref:Rieske 2Fe-2S domain-containing protein n=1 Tax=Terasakiella pusilla TaxID=64973 RepID=UPI003AA9C8D2